MDPVPTAPMERYLECTDVIDWMTPAVLVVARDLVAQAPSGEDKARVLYEWVRDHILHSHDIGADTATLRASEVLRHGTGICYAKSHLLAALLRASGIPAGLCYQIYDRAALNGGKALHGLNGVWLPTRRRWVRLDCRGNKPGVDAQFSPNSERLAFPTDPLYDDKVYPAPFASVVRALSTARNCAHLWELLPDGP